MTVTLPSTTALGDPLRPGDVLGGKYRIDGVLGRTAMGIVYLARHLELDRAVAVKLLVESALESPELLGRFRREAQILAKLANPHVVRIFDVGSYRDRLPYIVMEHLAGEDLGQLLAREAPITVERACNLVMQAAHGLAAAHAQGVVHRDVKPSNLFVVTEPDGSTRVTVIDFGIAKLGPRADEPADAGVSDFTQTNTIVGSPRYMSPEQVNGSKSLDARSDVWSLGVILYEAITGSSLFRMDTSWQLFATILTQDAPSLLEKAPHAPPALAAALAGALQREATRRTPDMLAFASAIAPFASSGFRDPEHSDTHTVVVGEPSTATPSSPPEATSPGLTRCALPAEPNAFVGRDEDMRSLGDRIERGSRLVTLLGIGGTGKTRLATHFGWHALDQFAGGVWFCDLSDSRTLEGIAFVVADVLGVPLGKDDPIAQLGQAIAGRGPCLIVLDNFEQVTAHGRATVGQWLARAPEARFIVTSRELLGLEGEDVFALDPLASSEAVELFEARATAIRPGFTIAPSERGDAEALVRLLDYLPLAIELAAARVRVMKLSVILERMSERFKLLTTTGGRRARQATLRGALDWSWDLLSEDERSALAQLSVCEGGFSLEAAEAVLSLEELWPLDAIQALVDKSLVRAAKDGRFTLLVSVQQYAAERLDARGERADAELRHSVYYASFGERAAIDALDTHGGRERRAALVREIENLAGASARALQRGDAETAGKAAIAAWAVVEMRGPYGPGIRCLEAARAIAPRRSALEGSLDIRLGHAFRLSGRVDDATTILTNAIGVLRELGDRREEGLAVSALGHLKMERGAMQESRTLFTEAVALHRQVGNRAGEALDLCLLGASMCELGDNVEGRTIYDLALVASRESGNRRAEALTVSNLAGISLVEADLDRACELYEQALGIYREIGVQRAQANCLTNVGETLAEMGRFDEARARLEQALGLYSALGNERGTGMALAELGAVHLRTGDLEQARHCLGEGEAVLRKVDDRFQLCLLLANRAAGEAAESPALARADLAEAEAYANAMNAGPDSQLRLRIAKARLALVGG